MSWPLTASWAWGLEPAAVPPWRTGQLLAQLLEAQLRDLQRGEPWLVWPQCRDVDVAFVVPGDVLHGPLDLAPVLQALYATVVE